MLSLLFYEVLRRTINVVLMVSKSLLIGFFCFFAIVLVQLFTSAAPLYAAGVAEAGSLPTEENRALPPVWLLLPFVLLLLMIATGPLFYHRFWEHNYPGISVGLGTMVALWYGFMMEHGGHILEHTIQEYFSFITLIASLFIVSGGILIDIERRGTPLVNTLLLLSGAVISNFIGTTGASMLLIRPFLRINKGRIKPFHIVFFIFIISNIGGALTPIGDPPLFLGFLKGVPFFWVLPRLWLPWLIAIGMLLLIFFVLDMKTAPSTAAAPATGGGIRVSGRRNFIFLILIIGAVFLDPAVIDGFPSLQKLFHLPFGIRELFLFILSIIAYKTANRNALKGNEFNFEPVREVAFLFIGIFLTMMPALELIGGYARQHASDLSLSMIYWMTGLLSGVLDNAPTYLNFLSAALGKFGLDIGDPRSVLHFTEGVASPVSGDVTSDIYLVAISVASVFFGAMTYIGNAPNFMVKNIAAQSEVEVPDFVEYIVRYSVPVLLPIFLVLWFLFFNL